MKGRIGLILLLQCLTLVAFGTDYRALANGLPAKVTFIVTDDEHRPIPDATISAVMRFLGEKHDVVTVRTDTKGVAAVEGRVLVEMAVTASKQGYYDAHWSKAYLSRDSKSVQQSIDLGKWRPWNPSVLLILKQNKKIPSMRHIRLSRKLPLADVAFGLDLFDGDFVAPYGAGRHADVFVVCFFRKTSEEYQLDLTVFSTNGSFGVAKMKKDWSSGTAYPYVSEAPQTGYCETITFSECISPSASTNTFLNTSSDYLLFKATRKTEDIVCADYYGIVLQSSVLDVRSGKDFIFYTDYYINTNQNSRLVQARQPMQND